MATKKFTTSITLSEQGWNTIKQLKANCINISSYIDRLITNSSIGIRAFNGDLQEKISGNKGEEKNVQL